MTRPATGEYRNVVAGATYLDWTREARSFAGIAAFRPMDINVTGDDDFPERISGVSITPEFFRVLGITAALGRLPAPDDDPATAAGTVALSDALWKARYGADRRILGTPLILNGKPHTIVAVLPPGLEFPEGTGLYVPSPYRVPLTPLDDQDMSDDRTSGYLRVVGRLRDGASIGSAQAEMRALTARMGEEARDTTDAIEPLVVSLQEDLVGDVRPTFFVLLGAVGLVLLIACANVANLLTIRATRRRREIAVRISLGAGLARIRRQLLTEAVALAVLGGVPGFLLALWGTRALVAIAPAGIPRLSEVAVDPRILGFSVAITLVTGFAFGLAPMVGLSGKGANLTLRDARTQARTERLRDFVVITEIALSLLLVIGAGLMLRTLRVLDRTDPGFDPSHVLVAHVSLPASNYPDPTAQAAFYDDALARIRALPGVESASTILTLPMHWAIRGTFHFSIFGRAAEAQRDLLAGYQSASPDYFRTLRIPLLRGRAIEETDREDGPGVVVINEAMARRYWPGSDPLGQRVTFWGDPDDPDTEWSTIVGVVGNTVKEGLDQTPEPEAYMPVTQAPMSRSSFVVRTPGDPYALAPAVRRAIQDADPTLPLYGLMSMNDVLAHSLDSRRFRLLLLGIFASTALLLAAVGLYGVISFSVSLRTREIGIRMALGAQRDTVVRHVVRQGLTRVLLGLSFGALASLALTRAIASQIFGVRASDPITYAASALLLATVALAACLVPALRAARVDPAVAVHDS